MIWLGIIIGLIIGVPSSILLYKQYLLKESNKIRRRGIISTKFKSGDGLISEITYQIGELEKSSDMSKIFVDKVTSNQNKTNNIISLKMFYNLKHLTWVESSNIKWLDDEVKVNRNEVLCEILN